jgi:hypothetical protein
MNVNISPPVNYLADTKKVVLFTNARDESNIKEWAAHHLLIGFTHIHIFDHKSNIPLANVFNGFDKRVSVQRIERTNQDGSLKLNLMRLASIIAKKMKADWMLYLDADEFLILNKHIGIKKLLNDVKPAHSLAVNWVMFGTNNHVKTPDGLILDNYTKSDLLLNFHVKSFVRPNEVTRVTSPHFFHIKHPNKMYSIDGGIMDRNVPYYFHYRNNNVPFSNAIAYVAHYVNQAEETYIKRKINLPTDDGNLFRARDLNIHQHHNAYVNEEPKNKYASVVKAFLQK